MQNHQSTGTFDLGVMANWLAARNSVPLVQQFRAWVEKSRCDCEAELRLLVQERHALFGAMKRGALPDSQAWFSLCGRIGELEECAGVLNAYDASEGDVLDFHTPAEATLWVWFQQQVRPHLETHQLETPQLARPNSQTPIVSAN